MPVYVQEVLPHLQGEIKCRDNNERRKTYEDTSSDNVPNAAAPHAPLPFMSRKNNNLPKKIHLTQLQFKFINDTMKGIREKENTKAKKQKISHDDASLALHQQRKHSSWTNIFLERLSSSPDVAQIVASSGGLVTYWNESFSHTIARSSKSLRNFPVTIFEVIEPESLPSLYGMLAMALNHVPIVEDEDEVLDIEGEAGNRTARENNSSHLSITLPCKLFHGSSSRYNITIIFMDDLSSRCFIGILTSTTPSHTSSKSDLSAALFDGNEETVCQIETSEAKPTLPRGKIIRASDDVLCRLIFGSG